MMQTNNIAKQLKQLFKGKTFVEFVKQFGLKGLIIQTAALGTAQPIPGRVALSYTNSFLLSGIWIKSGGYNAVQRSMAITILSTGFR